jgi:hypothetical protein
LTLDGVIIAPPERLHAGGCCVPETRNVVTSFIFESTDQFDSGALTTPAKAGDALSNDRVEAIVRVLRLELESNQVVRAARLPPAPAPAPVDVEYAEGMTAERSADIEVSAPPARRLRRTTAVLKTLVASAIAAPVAYYLAAQTVPLRPELSAAPTLASVDTPLGDMTFATGSNGTAVPLADTQTGAPKDTTPTSRPLERSNADNLSESDKFLVERNRRFHEAGDAIETLLLGHNSANANNASIAVGLGTSQVGASIDGRAYFGNPKSWYDQAKELWGLQHRRGSGVAGRP